MPSASVHATVSPTKAPRTRKMDVLRPTVEQRVFLENALEICKRYWGALYIYTHMTLIEVGMCESKCHFLKLLFVGEMEDGAVWLGKLLRCIYKSFIHRIMET